MNPFEFAFGLVLVIVLGLFAIWLIILQFRQFKKLPGLQQQDPEFARYIRKRIFHRLLAALLMLLFAGFLVTSYFVEPEFQKVANASRGKENPPSINPEEKIFLHQFTYFWIGALFILFCLLVVSGFEILVTLKQGLRLHSNLRKNQLAELQDAIRALKGPDHRIPPPSNN